MKFTFGLHLDGCCSADVRPTSNELVCGPAGLLRVLELRLGRLVATPGHGRRVVGYREALAALAAGGHQFYSDSFAGLPRSAVTRPAFRCWTAFSNAPSLNSARRNRAPRRCGCATSA